MTTQGTLAQKIPIVEKPRQFGYVHEDAGDVSSFGHSSAIDFYQISTGMNSKGTSNIANNLNPVLQSK